MSYLVVPARSGESGWLGPCRATRLGALLLALLLEANVTMAARADDLTSTPPKADSVALELVWKVPLGSGNSRVSVADGRVVTLFSDGETDWLVALDAGTGSEHWRYR